MSTGRKIYKIVIYLLFTGLAVYALLATFLFTLPYYVEKELIPSIANYTHIEKISANVGKVGWDGAEVGNLEIGDIKTNSIRVGSIRLDYSPRRLLKRHIDRIRISGAGVTVFRKNKRFTIPGLDFKAPSSSAKKKPLSENSKSLLPFSFNKITIDNSVLHIEMDNRRIPVFFEMEIVPGKKQARAYICKLTCYLRGEKLNLSFAIDVGSQTVDAVLQNSVVRVGAFSDWLTGLSGIKARGPLEINGNLRLGYSPFKLENMEIRAEYFNEYLARDPFRLETAHRKTREKAKDKEKSPAPITFQLNSGQKQKLEYNLENVRFNKPFPFAVKLNGTIVAEDGFPFIKRQTRIEGDIFLKIPPVQNLRGVRFENPVEMNYRYAVLFPENKGRLIKIGTGDKNTIDTRIYYEPALDGGNISAADPVIDLSAEIGEKQFEAKIKVLASDFLADINNNTLKAKHAVVKAELNHIFSSGTKNLKVFSHLTLNNPGLETETVKWNAPEFAIGADIYPFAEKQLRVNGQTRTENGSISIVTDESALTAQDLRITLPFSWPPEKETKTGSVSLKQIRVDDKAMGDINGHIKQENKGIVFSGGNNNPYIPGMQVMFKGNAGFTNNGPVCHIEVDCGYETDEGLDLARIFPSGKDYAFTGKMTGKGVVDYKGNQLDLSLLLKLNQADVTKTNQDFLIENIDLDLDLSGIQNKLPTPVSRLSFQNGRIGKFLIREGEIVFRLDGNRSFLVEKFGFKWAGGSVESMSFTVDPDTGDFFVVFYCDRIKLPMLLEQLDLAEATGEGTVSGKIPLQYKNGEIIFQDGFLYSSPGDKGTISVKKAKYLSTGIPKGTARFAQVELALEALKSFQYQWAKVIMQTLEKDLLLKIQFNGQPTKPLPFQYSKEIGGFIRVGPEKQKSKFQEIQLDVNFRLPLKKLLELKNIIQLLSS